MYEKMWYELLDLLKRNDVKDGQLRQWTSHEIISCMDAIERGYLKAMDVYRVDYRR